MVCPWMGEEVLPVEEIPVHESPLVPYEEQPPASSCLRIAFDDFIEEFACMSPKRDERP